MSFDIDSTVTNRFKQDLAVGPSQALERQVLLWCAMEETLYGSIRCTISPLLTTGDAVLLQTVTSWYNEVNKSGVLERCILHDAAV